MLAGRLGRLVVVWRLPHADGRGRFALRRDDAGHRAGGRARSGGIRLEGHAPWRCDPRADLPRKLSVLAHLPYYAGTIAKEVQRVDVVHIPAPGDMPLLGMLIALFFRKRLIVPLWQLVGDDLRDDVDA